MFAPSPNTDINDGKDVTSDCELVVIGIVEFWRRLLSDGLLKGNDCWFPGRNATT